MDLGKPVVVSALLLCLMAGLTTGAGARGQRGEGHGYFYAGTSFLDLDKLNEALTARGYPSFATQLFSMGGGGHAFVGRLVLGGQGQALFGRSKDVVKNSTPYKTNLRAGIGTFDIGYVVTPPARLQVFPMLGIGGGGLEMTVVEKQPPAFGEILEHPARGARLSTGVFLLNLALGVDYLVPTRRHKSAMGGLILGLEVGYTFTPFFFAAWSADDIEITGGPDVGITGPYLRLKIGGGGRRERCCRGQD
ncbi:MAG: hypothetical protein ACUVTG_05350 [Candidatus Oleimicrobiaceae bacterium]